MVRTAPQGLEVFRPMANPEEPNKVVMTIDYYSVEVNASTVSLARIYANAFTTDPSP